MRADEPSPAEGAGQGGAGARRYPLIRIQRATAYRLPLTGVARRSGLPPDMVRRFVALGLVDAERDTDGRLWFRTTAPAALARVQRLRTGLSLNYAAVGVVLDLLDRIDRLESALRQRERAAEERTPWT
ncbi:chaperone modulator CbpM [Streptomyces albipurpureus]|uniref:Chaperone modulator CbpM n=1 Tax=Streptomyces albipurpureus TaxID=2897419 RepID=A0ABT0UPI0_9ACTN|nr:chaperone modulator CbpM [Streptomyces sp. CWNU-1]MCM2390532.1 chaperone modulator CbpM [Streptomyces sp. CWNU-1]